MRSLAALLLVLGVAACGTNSEGDNGENDTACEAAFRHMAAVDVRQDEVADLDAAVRACSTEDEWTAAAEAFPDALDGGSPGVFLRSRCFYDTVLAETVLCQSLESPDI